VNPKEQCNVLKTRNKEIEVHNYGNLIFREKDLSGKKILRKKYKNSNEKNAKA